MSKGTLYVWLVPGVLLGLFFFQIHPFWDPESNYNYGWVVPLLVACLIWRRCGDAPEPSGAQPLFLPAAALLIAAASFVRLLWEGMGLHEWIFLTWLQGSILVLFSLVWLALWRGGRWALHFLFPLVFVLTAIPWPGFVERPVIDLLTELIAGFVTSSLQGMGIPAVLEGIVISIGSARVEVAEACSGIRSFQLLLVSGLFLGDYGRFGLGKRVLLFVGGLLAAFIQNAGRALALGWITGIHGTEAYEKWHEPSGMISFSIGMGLVCIFYILLEKLTSSSRPRERAHGQDRSPRFCLAFSSVTLVGLILVEAFAFFWMRFPLPAQSARWDLSLTELHQLPLHRSTPVDERVNEMLDTPYIAAGEFVHDGKRVHYTHVDWPDGLPVVVANYHNPSHCMALTGLRQIGEREFARLGEEFGGVSYEIYHFEQPKTGKKFLVFRTLMIPESDQKRSYEFIPGEQGYAYEPSRFRKLGFAVDRLVNRIGQDRFEAHNLILLGIEVEDPRDPQVVSDPQALEDFIRRGLSPPADS